MGMKIAVHDQVVQFARFQGLAQEIGQFFAVRKRLDGANSLPEIDRAFTIGTCHVTDQERGRTQHIIGDMVQIDLSYHGVTPRPRQCWYVGSVGPAAGPRGMCESHLP